MSTATSDARAHTVTLAQVGMEFLRHRDNYVYLVPTLLLLPWIAWTAGDWGWVAWFVVGWLVFLPQEHLTHVYILHYAPPRTARAYAHMYRLHYGHHDLPRRLDLMYMPLWLTLPMTAGNTLLFYLLTNTWHDMLAAMCGLFVGYLLFEWSHLLCHVPYMPKTAAGKIMRQRHLWHHFRNEKLWYSVSVPALPIDAIARTAPTFKDAPASANCRFLGLTEQDQRLLAARRRYAPRSSGDLERSAIWLAPANRTEARA